MTTQEREAFEKIFTQWTSTRAGSAVAKFINAARDFNDDFRAAFDAALYKTLEYYFDRDDQFKEAAAFEARMNARDAMREFKFTGDQIDRVLNAIQNAAHEYVTL